MMTPTIRVDDEVYGLLQAEAEPFVDTPNSVLRKKLGLDPDQRPTTGGRPISPPAGRGKIGNLLDAKYLKPEDELVWDRTQQGRKYRCWVCADGRLKLEDGSYRDSASGAARHLAGYEVNGLRAWKTADGTSLEDLWLKYVEEFQGSD